MSESNPNVLSLAKLKADRKQASQAAKVDTPERMLELAAIIIEANNLIIDSDVTVDGKGVQYYSLNQSDNTLEPVSDEELDTLIFKAEPQHLQRGRVEVASYIRKELQSNKDRCRSLAQVAAVAFADEADVLTFKRFAFSRAEAASISLDSLPEFKFILSLASDPAGLTLWIGSLLDWTSARVQYLHWYGGGGNGKSTLFSAIQQALGSRIVTRADVSDILSPHWGQQLVGARLLIVPDTNSTRAFSTGKWKALTGEDYLTINPKNRPHREIKLTQKIAVISNNKVAINGSAADSRRLLPISSRPDPDGDVPHKWWYQGLMSSGERILLYCYNEWAKAVAEKPELRAGIPAQEEALAEAVEERYGDTLAMIEGIVIPTHNQALPSSTLCADVYRAIGDARGRQLSNMEMKEIKEALQTMGIEKAKKNKGRVFLNCKIKAAKGD